MTTQDRGFNLELSRRKLIVGAGIGAGAVAAASVIGTGVAEAAPASGNAEAAALDPVTTPPVAGLHLQFGADASAEMVVSWHTRQPVRNPRVVLGRLDGKLEQTVEAKPTVTPTESPAKSSTPTMLGSVGCRVRPEACNAPSPEFPFAGITNHLLGFKDSFRSSSQITRFSASTDSSLRDSPNSVQKISTLCSPISGARLEIRQGEPL